MPPPPRPWSRPMEELARSDLERCAALWLAVWPDLGDVDAVVARCRELVGSTRYREPVVHGVDIDGATVALARSFVRIIRSDEGERRVLALAGVCSDPDRRGLGLGRLVVEDAFARLDDRVTVCLFQTQVPTFYRRLGCREVANAFVDSSESAKTFWDPHVMIHPAGARWPAGEIDLQGPAW